MTHHIIDDTPLVRDPRLLATVIDDEIILLHVDTGRYYGVAGTGRRVWELLDRSRPLSELCACLAAEFEVDDAVCRAEVRAFVRTLVDEGIVHSWPGPGV